MSTLRFKRLRLQDDHDDNNKSHKKLRMLDDETCSNSNTPTVTINPLLIPHIIESVFAYLVKSSVIQDWKNFRLVCREWKLATQKYFENPSMVCIRFGSEICGSNRESAEAANRLQKFMKNMAKCKKLPVQKIVFSPDFFTRLKNFQNHKDLRTFHRFFTYRPEWLKSLEICLHTFNFANEFSLDPNNKFKFYEKLSLPYLKDFKFTVNKLIPRFNLELFKLLEGILKASNYLENFQLYICNLNSEEWSSQEATVIAMFDNLPNIIPLSVIELHLAVQFRDHHLEMLSERGLKLQQFYWESRNSFMTGSVVRKFLETQKDSLKVFYFDSNNILLNMDLHLPVFTNLKVLKIVGNKVFRFSFACFPMATDINISKWMVPFSYFNVLDTQSLVKIPTLKKLHFPISVNKQILEEVPKFFPNLTYFSYY